MNRLKTILIFTLCLFFNSCSDETKFGVVRMFYIDHKPCGDKNYSIFEVSYEDSWNFPEQLTDTLTINGKLYDNLVLFEVPDTLTGVFYGSDYYGVGKTKINCKEMEHMSEVSPLRSFNRVLPERKRPE